jgi:hypothetical protein
VFWMLRSSDRLERTVFPSEAKGAGSQGDIENAGLIQYVFFCLPDGTANGRFRGGAASHRGQDKQFFRTVDPSRDQGVLRTMRSSVPNNVSVGPRGFSCEPNIERQAAVENDREVRGQAHNFPERTTT